MKSFRQQLLESFPLAERLAVDRVSRKLCPDDNDPLLWFLLNMRSADGLHAKWFQPRNWLPALALTIVTSLMTILMSFWMLPHFINDSHFQLTTLESTMVKIQTETESARNKLEALNKDARILTGNQDAVFQKQIEVFSLIRDQQKHYEQRQNGGAEDSSSSR